jgi:hypothetical protein
MPEFKTYLPNPRTIEAAYFEKAGKYDLEGYPIEIDTDDTYVIRTEDGYATRTGEFFRNDWVPGPGGPLLR